MTQNDVDVDALAESIVLFVQERDIEEPIDGKDNNSVSVEESEAYQAETIYQVTKLITEALAGRWKNEDLQKAFDGGVSSVNKYGETLETFEEWLSQFKSEGGIK